MESSCVGGRPAYQEFALTGDAETTLGGIPTAFLPCMEFFCSISTTTVLEVTALRR
jgi:hypothetical protein